MSALAATASAPAASTTAPPRVAWRGRGASFSTSTSPVIASIQNVVALATTDMDPTSVTSGALGEL